MTDVSAESAEKHFSFLQGRLAERRDLYRKMERKRRYTWEKWLIRGMKPFFACFACVSVFPVKQKGR